MFLNSNEILIDTIKDLCDKLSPEAYIRLVGKLIGSSPAKLRAALGRKSKLSALELLKVDFKKFEKLF